MTMDAVDHHAVLVAAGIASVLIVASIVGGGLKITVAKGEPHATIDNLNARVNAWWIIAAVVGLALVAGRTGATILFALASLIALREFAGSSAIGRTDTTLLVSFIFVLPFQYFAVHAGWTAIYSTFIPLFAFVTLLAYAIVRREDMELRRRIAIAQEGVVLCVYCISFVPALLTLDIAHYEGRNAFLLLFLLVVVQGSDVLQYIWGKLVGRHKLAPRVSPAKTVEGAVGGVLSATALGAVLSPMTPFTALQATLVSLLITVLGLAGGLLVSSIKRERGLKDWGTLIPGHGGMFDRLDSLCFSAPVFFYVVRFGWAA